MRSQQYLSLIALHLAAYLLVANLATKDMKMQKEHIVDGEGSTSIDIQSEKALCTEDVVHESKDKAGPDGMQEELHGSLAEIQATHTYKEESLGFKGNEMPEEMWRYAMMIFRQGLDTYTQDQGVAKFVKRNFDEKYGGRWAVFVGDGVFDTFTVSHSFGTQFMVEGERGKDLYMYKELEKENVDTAQSNRSLAEIRVSHTHTPMKEFEVQDLGQDIKVSLAETEAQHKSLAQCVKAPEVLASSSSMPNVMQKFTLHLLREAMEDGMRPDNVQRYVQRNLQNHFPQGFGGTWNVVTGYYGMGSAVSPLPDTYLEAHFHMDRFNHADRMLIVYQSTAD